MSQEAHSHDTHDVEKKSKAPLSQAFWFTLLLTCLFIAAVNFVNVMSNDEGEGEGHGAHSEAVHENVHGEATHEATEQAAPVAEPATADTATLDAETHH